MWTTKQLDRANAAVTHWLSTGKMASVLVADGSMVDGLVDVKNRN